MIAVDSVQFCYVAAVCTSQVQLVFTNVANESTSFYRLAGNWHCSIVLHTSPIQYPQALLKAKYCLWVKPVASVGSNKVNDIITFRESRPTGSSSIMQARNTQKPM